MSDKQRTSYLLANWRDPSSDDLQELQAPLHSSELITIGRGSSNTIVLNSRQVSTQHAEVKSDNHHFVITDMGSVNGTFVNGERIKEATPLKDGDSILIRPIDFTIAIKTPLKVRVRKAEMDEETTIAFLPISFGRGTRDKSITVVLSDDNDISRDHADIELRGEQLLLIDHSRNGTRVNGKKYKGHKEPIPIQPGDQIQIGQYTIEVEYSEIPPAPREASEEGTQVILELEETSIIDEATEVISEYSTRIISRREEATLTFDENTDLLTSISQPIDVLKALPTDLPSLFNQRIVPWEALENTRMLLQETTYLAIGGGLGSFAWVDHLVICGADPKQIVALGFPPKAPYARYQQLCRNSQIPGYERLRSGSDSCPDNIWGWPGYAVREIWSLTKKGDFSGAAQITAQIFNEPLMETYTPRSQDVFAAIDRESERIGWDEIWRPGRVEAIRKTDDGRYVILYSSPKEKKNSIYKLMVAKYVHLAVGYPGVRFLPDLVAYRKRTGDKKCVVNAYEPHEHVYKHLEAHGGTVVVRGRGIVASRVIQRLNEVRMVRLSEKNQNDICILHLMRTPKPGPIGYTFNRARRLIEYHFEFQPFNWPKATWGGPMRVQLEGTDDSSHRSLLLNDWAGTTTASRQDWREIIDRGLRERWYVQEIGVVERVERNSENGKVDIIIRSKDVVREQRLEANFIIDATGLDAKLDSNPLLNDLMAQYQLRPNSKGRLKIANDFEVVGMRNKDGRMYAAGVMTLGGPYAPVDTFLGLQYAALRSVDALSKLKATKLKKLNGIRSLWQWLKWARGVTP